MKRWSFCCLSWMLNETGLNGIIFFHWQLTLCKIKVQQQVWEFANIFISDSSDESCACVLESNMLLAGLFIERADPSKPGLKKSQVASHASSTEQNAISFWEMYRFRMRWTMGLVCGTSAVEFLLLNGGAVKPLTSYYVKSVKQWSVPESQCISKLLFLWGKKIR